MEPKKAKGANGRSQVPCLWLPADALSLDAPSWCWTPHPSGTVPNIHVQPNKARRKDWKMLTKVCLSSEVDDVMFNVPPPPGADRLNRSRVINWSKRLSSFSAQFWVEGWPAAWDDVGKSQNISGSKGISTALLRRHWGEQSWLGRHCGQPFLLLKRSSLESALPHCSNVLA